MSAVPKKKIVVDEQGKPPEVIIPWSDFCEIAETMGWDLDSEAEADLRETRRDLEGKKSYGSVPMSAHL
jgi:hypothetical protein